MSDTTKESVPQVVDSSATETAKPEKESLGHKIADKLHKLGEKHDETVEAQAEHLVNDRPSGGKPFTLQT